MKHVIQLARTVKKFALGSALWAKPNSGTVVPTVATRAEIYKISCWCDASNERESKIYSASNNFF